MKTLSVMFGLLASAAAQDCSTLVINNQSNSCDPGSTPADTDTITACASTLCGLMDTWGMARGADENKRLMGSSYGCYVEDGTGADDIICMPGNVSKPTPTPTAPPTPTPTAQYNCSSLVVNKQSNSCNPGSTPADTDTITVCASTLCGQMDTWGMAHGADENKLLLGSGFGCYVADETQTGVPDTICMPGTVPKPTPTPTAPPTPTPTAAPIPTPAPQYCSSLVINKQSNSCDPGSTPADTDTVTACASTLCGQMDTWDMAHGADEHKILLGSVFGCFVADETQTGVGDIICMPGNVSKPTPTPTAPLTPTPTAPPIPTPTAQHNCSSLVVNKQSNSCDPGSTPADTDTITACVDTLCYLMDTWGMAHGADENKRLMGSSYGCHVEDGTGAGDIICMPGNVSKPTPTPAQNNCTSLVVNTESNSCDSGSVPADLDRWCLPNICAMMDPYAVVRADATHILKGSAFGCYVTNGTANGVICMPGDPEPPTSTSPEVWQIALGVGLGVFVVVAVIVVILLKRRAAPQPTTSTSQPLNINYNEMDSVVQKA